MASVQAAPQRKQAALKTGHRMSETGANLYWHVRKPLRFMVVLSEKYVDFQIGFRKNVAPPSLSRINPGERRYTDSG